MDIPIGELKVHNLELGSSKCICQNPFDASFEMFALANRDKISSGVESLKCYLIQVPRIHTDSKYSISLVYNK